MISWLWLIPAFFAGVSGGFFYAALCHIARNIHDDPFDDRA